MLKSLVFSLLLSLPFAAFAQNVPPPSVGFGTWCAGSNGLWSACPGGSTASGAPVTPPPTQGVALWCAGTNGLWAPCTSGGGGSGLLPTTVAAHNTQQSTLLSGTSYVRGY
jgi:hypothetical protein